MTFTKSPHLTNEQLRNRAVKILADYHKPYLDSWNFGRIAGIPEPTAATILRQSGIWREVGTNEGPVTYTKFKRNPS